MILFKKNCKFCNKEFETSKPKAKLHCSTECKDKYKRQNIKNNGYLNKYYNDNKEKYRLRGKKRNIEGKNVYSKILQRCNNPNDKNYFVYGAKGIRCILTQDEFLSTWNKYNRCQVCDRELTRGKFGKINVASKCTDRIDSNKNYSINNIQIICLSCNSIKNNKIVRIGIKSGRWEILHKSHIATINKCKNKCDYLIVLVHDCKTKPSFISADQRKYIMSNLYAVNQCDIYIEDTEDIWIENFVKNNFFRFGPNKELIIFHSEEIRDKELIPGKKFANEIIFIPRDNQISCTDIYKKILERV